MKTITILLLSILLIVAAEKINKTSTEVPKTELETEIAKEVEPTVADDVEVDEDDFDEEEIENLKPVDPLTEYRRLPKFHENDIRQYSKAYEMVCDRVMSEYGKVKVTTIFSFMQVQNGTNIKIIYSIPDPTADHPMIFEAIVHATPAAAYGQGEYEVMRLERFESEQIEDNEAMRKDLKVTVGNRMHLVRARNQLFDKCGAIFMYDLDDDEVFWTECLTKDKDTNPERLSTFFTNHDNGVEIEHLELIK